MKSNLPVGIIAILLGLYYSISSLQLPEASMGAPRAHIFFPLVLGVAMVIIGIVLAFRGYREIAVAKQAAAQSADSGEEKQTGDSRDKNFWILIAGAVVLAIIYTLVFTTVGFLISTAAFLFALFVLVNGLQSWLKHGVIAIVFSVTIWFIFQNFFMLNLP